MFSRAFIDCWRTVQHGCGAAAVFPTVAHVIIPSNGVWVLIAMGANAFTAVNFPSVEAI